MDKQKIFTLKIGGQAGQGIKSAGLLFSKVAARSGYHTYDYTEYPSLIRGGHNMMQIHISEKEVLGPSQKTDLLIALNQETIDLHCKELEEGSGILFDEEKNFDTSKVSPTVNLFPVPLERLATEAGGKTILSNTVALGAAVALLEADITIFTKLLAEEFVDKSQEIILANQKAAKLGSVFVKEHYPQKIQPLMARKDNAQSLMVVNGNDAVVLGAIVANMQFAAIYPMSPISGILQTLALYQDQYNYIYRQSEDEIAAINMAIGASIAGARSLTATSGGGFCLMTEGLGLAGIIETPLVIIEGMRPGPATGLPTWSEQGDLSFVLNSAQGSFPKIVLAAGDSKEAFDLTKQAFNLADKYQTPVILLIDKNLCENNQSFALFDSGYKLDRGKLVTEKVENYQRYKLEDDGISKRTVPGVGNFFIANSDEHDETGFDNEEIDNRKNQMKKRMAKLKTCADCDMPTPQLFGPKEADLTFVSWGSNKGVILQAIKNFPSVNFLHLTWLSPFPREFVKNILSKAKYIIDIECNFEGQLANLIREKTGIVVNDKLLKYDGRPFFAEEITEVIKKTLQK